MDAGYADPKDRLAKFFANREIAVATMHNKERVIGPILEKELGLIVRVPKIDTDRFGTFSGEIKREKAPLDAAIAKCRLAMEQSGLDLAIASEGSFGPHPYLFFAQANEEIVVLIDEKNKLQIVGRELSTQTNHDKKEAFSTAEAIDFANSIGFPEHGVILKDRDEAPKIINKSVLTSTELHLFLANWFKSNDKIWIESDLRAMRNPTRMRVIEKATINLMERLMSLCPNCQTPGFWVVESIQGLPCQVCSSPTRSTLAHRYACDACSYDKKEFHPHGKLAEDPMYCDTCNP